MRANGGGVILNCSSGAALVSIPGVPVCTATKGAITALCRAFALDLGQYNIRVNTLCPMGGMSANFMRDPGCRWSTRSRCSRITLRPTPLPRCTDPPRPGWSATPRRRCSWSPTTRYWVSGVALPTDDGAAIRPQMDLEKTIKAYHTARFVTDA
jgi:NAD(P)-dependent dehydrogenase (short-subunit alcohol dehydrogenase family)